MPMRVVLVALFVLLQYAVLFSEDHAGVTELRNALAISAFALHAKADTRLLKFERGEYRLSDLAQDVGKHVNEVSN